jgi:hypothetical protein
MTPRAHALHPNPLLTKRNAAIAAGALVLGSAATYGIVRLVRGRSKGPGIIVDPPLLPPPDSSPEPEDDADDPTRTPVWSDEEIASITVDARGWTTPVIEQPCDAFFDCWVCAAPSMGSVDDHAYKGGGYWNCREIDGNATPVAQEFLVPLTGVPSTSVVVLAEVTVTDPEGTINRESIRTKKNSSGRARGNIDVNEVELQGTPFETSYCERLGREFPVIAGEATPGQYLTRRRVDCGGDPTYPQTYSLYRAQRVTTLKGAFNKVREWFAKVRLDTPPYPIRKPIPAGPSYDALYNLQLGLDDRGIYLSGAIAPSLAPQQLNVQVTWRTRPL